MAKRFLRFCSMVLAIVMVINMLPLNVLAEELTAGTLDFTINTEEMDTSTDLSGLTVVEEHTESRTEFIKEFMLSNGLQMATVYPTAVHFEKDGEWVDIDNTLQVVGTGLTGTFQNTEGIWDVSFPRQLSNSNHITVTKDGYTLQVGMQGALFNSGSVLSPPVEVAGSGSDEEVETASIAAEAIAPAATSEKEESVAAVTEEEETESLEETTAPTAIAETEENILSSENTVTAAGITYSFEAVQASSGQIQHINTAQLQREAQFSETVPDKLHSKLLYQNIYENTNVTYDLQSNQIKESVILRQYDENLRGYQFRLDVGSLVPVLNDNGQIDLYDAEQDEIIMVIEAPFLIDDAGEYTADVNALLSGEGSSYTLIYLLPQEWLSAENRTWPVILDPVISATTTTENIRDQSVFEYRESDYTWGMLECGYGPNDGKERFYISYDELPSLGSGSVIVGAAIQLYKPETSEKTLAVEVHKVNTTWDSSTLHWSNQPSFSSVVEDFARVKNAGYYYWDVTDIARGWYAGSNTGMVFKGSDAVENARVENWKQFYSSDYGADKPVLSIVYRNNNGLEDYWDYTASSAGRAGTGYVNNYTGNLVWVRNLIGFDGARMPVNISLVYNSNDGGRNDYGFGYGWKTNYNQTVKKWSEDSNYYIWEDGDGTKHYFKLADDGTYKDEDGLELTLTIKTEGLLGTTKTYQITDKYGNQSIFNRYGYLTEIRNNQETTSSITITYSGSSTGKISYIKDGAGRAYVFNYTSQKVEISRGESVVTLTLSRRGVLESIKDVDNTVTYYTYTNNRLTSAQDVDGYKINYSYNVANKINKISEFSGTTAGGELSIEYAHNQTTFTDYNGNVQIMQFNNFGNTVSIQDGEGHAQFARYATDTSSAGKGNQLVFSSKMQNTVGNVLEYGNFESGVSWLNLSEDVALSSGISSTESYLGSKSLYISEASGEAVYSPSFTIAAGDTYTFSAYVKTVSGEAYLGIYDGSETALSTDCATTNEWQRLQVSYTNNTDSAITARAAFYGTNDAEAFMDCVQVEKAPTASRYNLVENGDFRYTSSWNSSSNRGTYASPAPQLNATAQKITGFPTAKKSVYQTVRVSGSAGDTYIIAGWAKADAVPFSDFDSNPREFAIMATFNYTDGTTGAFFARFNPDTDSINSWQYSAAAAVAKKAYSSIRVDLVYDYNANLAVFDGIQLIKEEFGNSYTYDSKGNVTAVKDIQAETTAYEYVNNNLTKQTLPTGAKLTYTYDDYHNVLTATSDAGVDYAFTYDTYGNNTSVSIVDGNTKITSTATYSTDGNRLVSTTDALGNTTTYGYNATTNVLEWVQYPENTEATHTNYTYDALYRLATATTTTDTGAALSTSYTYDLDRLTSIQTPSTTYSLSYGDFSLRSQIQIGERTLATYSYTARNNYLSSLDYGNEDAVQYTYDNLGRVTLQTFEDGTTVSYGYDNDGALATVTDSESGITTTYYYDFTDRLMRYVEAGTNYRHAVGYEYDEINNLETLVETINGVDYTTSYTYDNDNRVTSVTSGDASRSYTYDNYSRVTEKETKNGTETILTDTISYRSPTDTTTSAQISTYAITAEDYSAAYTYQYDDNGNILSVSDGTNTTSYVYDSENQLLRENNQAVNKTWTWEYDNAGNILSRKEYPYTTESLESLSPAATFAYTYGDESWGDLLTGYAGQTITSDAIGNMLSNGIWTYTWKHGRELASMSSGSVTWNFTYNADDLRTRRTNGTTTYDYTYNGSTLTHMRVGSDVLHFVYDASGRPMAVTYNGTNYYYVTNLQGDVIAILDTEGTAVVTYTYDAWGKILTTGGEMADTLGAVNPLRYRGYVYDQETQLYYLQSRYYDPNIGRFINADVYAATGQGILGNNMFAYCNNNPVIYCDDAGNLPVAVVNTLAKMVLAGLANGIIGFSIEYFSGSGTFSSSVKEFGKNFWGGFLSGIPKIGDTLSVLYDVNEAIKSCNKAGITGRDRLFAVGSTVLTSLVPSVNSLDLTITSDLALSYLMGDAFIGFAPSLINEAYLNEIYSDQTQYAPQQIRCTTSVMSNVPAGGGMFNGVKTVNCIH